MEITPAPPVLPEEPLRTRAGEANEPPERTKEAINALYDAVTKQDAVMVQTLLNEGADPKRPNSQGFPPLRAAVIHNNGALVKLLLEHGADINRPYTVVTGDHKETRTLLFETAGVSTYTLLLKEGANVNAKNSRNETPLHYHASNWNSWLVAALVSAGADVNVVNKESATPLDNAIFAKSNQRKFDDEDFVDVSRILLKNNAVVPWSNPDEYFRSKQKPDMDPAVIKARLQLVHGWNAQREKGDMSFTLPIEVFRRGVLDIATYFAALGRDGRGRRASVLPLEPEAMLRVIESGKPSELASLTRAGTDANEDFRLEGREESGSDYPCEVASEVNEAVYACAVAPKLREMPYEAMSFQRAPQNPECSSQMPECIVESPEVKGSLNRCKVCVVGPSQWGKTSFIKSFTSGTPQRESVRDRTLGIDLFPWSFEVEDCEYQVSFWDFAGQEEYRAAHTLFYSSRSIYLLCIDLEQYHAELPAGIISTEDGIADGPVDEFAETHIFKWVRTICAHFPQAAFAFVGTKADLVQNDPDKIDRVQKDVVARFKRNTERMQDRVNSGLDTLRRTRDSTKSSDQHADTTELDDQIESWERSCNKQPVLLSEELIVFSSADSKYESIARDKLTCLLKDSKNSVKLPSSYANLLKDIQQRCTPDQVFQRRVDTAFVSLKAFMDSSQLAMPTTEMLAALHLLHDIGDIVWFDGVPDLQERLFLNPVLLIAFIRQIVNPEMDAKASVDGRVTNILIQNLPCWRSVNTATLKHLKKLLLLLNLAYSGSEEMEWDSDLIIPVYWDRDREATSAMRAKPFPTEEDKSAGLIECVRWEYSFEPAIPDNLFEKLAVATYSALLTGVKRNNGGSIFLDKTVNEFSTRVAIEDISLKCSMDGHADTISSVLSISVVARERTTAWEHLVQYCTELENLLKLYPGVLVTRYAVNSEGEHFNVDGLLSEQRKLHISTNLELLPADMKWYSDRWRQRTTATDTTKALTETIQDKAKFPSRWTLECHEFHVTTTVVVKFLSEISGKCYHDPISISIAKEPFSRFGKYLKVVLKLISAAVPGVAGQLVVGTISDECEGLLDRSMKFHEMLHGAGVSEDPTTGPQEMETNRNLSPQEVRDLLKDLLKFHDQRIEEDDIPKLSGLVCGVVIKTGEYSGAVKKAGEYIWASLDEICTREDIKLASNSLQSAPFRPPVLENLSEPKLCGGCILS
ncbi:hypothetical protein PRIC1_007777 [Phytophthora ramorum]|nr:26S proteasome non-ATPase regulatory subunit 10 [Phytophthora ramorum]